MGRKIFTTILYLMSVLGAFAQDIEVKKFELLEKDQTAALSPRKDINGVNCGLVKVAIKETGVHFEGNIIGEVEHRDAEYYVYLAQGTKRLNIKHSKYLPITIVFSDYGINKISSGKVYKLELLAEKQNTVKTNKTGMVIIQVIPSNAELLVDNTPVEKESSGLYTMHLTVGKHLYSARINDFSVNGQVLKVGGKMAKYKIDLTSFYSCLQVTSMTDDAYIYVNGEYKSQKTWKGMVMPGKYLLEARKNGCSTKSSTIEIQENDSININLGSLDMLMGKLQIKTVPSGCKVFIDHQEVGLSPLTLENLNIGTHTIDIKHDQCQSFYQVIEIEEGQNRLLSCNLTFKDKVSEWMVKAEEGDREAQYNLAECYMYNMSHISGWDKSMTNHKKAFEWYKKSAEQGYDNAQYALTLCYINGSGTPQDYSKSLFWARKGAEQNNEYCCYYVGWHYAYGRGVEKDDNQAIYWLKKAILINNNDDAKKLLKKLGYESEIPNQVTF